MRLFGKKQATPPPPHAPEQLPRHVAIIMDGNGRWAKAQGKPRAFGHRAGVEALREIIRYSSDIGIEALSLYAFSTENWLRPAEEVNALMELLLEFFAREIDELDEKQVAIRILGDVEGMPGPQRAALGKAMDRTRANTGLKLNIALNYGSRAELVRATRLLARQVADGTLAPDAIEERHFADALYTHGLPDVDLLIRTSGEQRLSNFLLYQCAYAEFVFVDAYWPDYTLTLYRDSLQEFTARQRRFGGL